MALGQVKPVIGAGQQGFHGFPRLITGDPGGQCHRGRPAHMVETGVGPLLAQAFHHAQGTGLVTLRQHHQELLAAEPRQVIAFA